MPPGKGFANTIINVDAVTRRIEQGLLYSAIATDPAVVQDASLDLLIRTSNQVLSPAIFSLLYGGAVNIQFFEGVTVSADGTPVADINHRRIQPIRPAETLTFQNPTVTDFGTAIIPGINTPGGTQGQNTVGGGRETLFWVLEKSTDYLFRLTSLATQDQPITIVTNFVEIVGPLSSGT
jgi:hypothetical protein